jgi:pimeloyl-ACP methyl ester carboxylesterase
MKHTLIFIHGANATYKSFNYVVRGLSQLNLLDSVDVVYLNYDSHNRFYDNLNSMHSTLHKVTGKAMIVAHSLGGIYATHLYSTRPNIISNVVTLSTPYAGVANANLMKWVFPYHQLLHDVGTYSKPILDSQMIKIEIPWIQVVSTTGDTPWMNPFIKNDGVVSQYSMTVREDIEYHYADSNHYEIVADSEVVDFISTKVTKFIS